MGNEPEKEVILTLPKDLLNIKPNMSRFGAFAGPVTITHHNANLNISYSSSTSSLNLYTSPPSSYNSASTKISLSSEENKFESFQPIITKDVTTQLNTIDEQNNPSISGIGYDIKSLNDINSHENKSSVHHNSEATHQVKYRNLQFPGYLQYQMTCSPLQLQQQAQQMQQFQQQQQLQLQQQKFYQQQQQNLIMQMQSFNQQQSQEQQQPILLPQYMPPDPKFMQTQQQMVSQYNRHMPQQSLQQDAAEKHNNIGINVK